MNRAHIPRSLTGLIFAVLITGLSPAWVQAKAEPGILKGKVIDKATREPLPYANVVFRKVSEADPQGVAAGGAMGMEDGTFESKVEPGSYVVEFLYIGYVNVRKTDIVVQPGQTVEVDAALVEDKAIEVETVEVKGEVIETSDGSQRAKLRKEAGVADAITSDTIAKTGDGNAADALERVSGVSVVGGKFVYIRGLGDRYSSTELNSSTIGTPETNKRVVPLDLFPSSVLANLIIQKTYTPDMNGDFGGGVVKINTSDFSKDMSFKQALSLGSRSGPDGYLSYPGGEWDFLGFDDGSRALPKEVAAYDKRIDSNVDLDTRRALTKTFPGTWSPRRSDLPTNWSYAGVYTHRMDLLGKDGGFLVAGSLSNDYNTIDRDENEWESGSIKVGYEAKESRREVLGGLTANYSMLLNEETKDQIKLNFLGSKNTTDLVKVSGGINEDYGVAYAQQTDLAYLERTITQTVLQGTHTVVGKSLLDWNLGYSTAGKNEPDRRLYIYERNPSDSLLYLGGRSKHPFQRLYGEGNEYARSAKLDLTVPLGLVGESESVSKLKFGWSKLSKDRNSAYRRFGFGCLRGGDCSADRTLDPEDLIVDDDGVNYVLEELTQSSDSWSGHTKLGAGYFMLDTPLTSWLRVIAGSRYEESKQDVVTRSPYSIRGVQDSYAGNNQDTRWLPSANAVFSFGKKTNVRAAWSQTVNRPELRELSPFEYYDWDKGWNVRGNPQISTAYLESWDLRAEYYPGYGASEMVAFSAFHKDFDKPIQSFMKPLSTGFVEEPFNATHGTLRGMEGEVRINLRTAYQALDWLVDLGGNPSYQLRNWGLMANYSLIDSEVEIDLDAIKGSGQGTKKYPFTGQSDYSVNWGLFCQVQRLESSLVYKTFGPRLALISEASQSKGLTEHPAGQLDFLCSYQLSGITTLKFSAKNLLDESTSYLLDDGLVAREYSTGRAFSVGISYSPGGGEE